MFVVKPVDVHDVMAALSIISCYKVRIRVMCYNPDSVKAANFVFVIEEDVERPDDHRLSEMAFQMNFRQKGKVCEVCKDSGEEFCGHLTFTSRIDR